jgi:hopene-associated glycosyltransferase HpnB
MIAGWFGAASCGVWIYLLAARGCFWRVRVPPGPLQREPERCPRVAIIIPARNEAETVGRAIQSLLQQDYPGATRIFIVDDHSDDDTAGVVNHVSDGDARVTLISSATLPAGWTGKMWALSLGVREATPFQPEYFLFTDADIVHAPGSVTSLVGRARSENRDLVSMMVKLRCSSLPERALIPAFVFFFFMLYPPDWVNNPENGTAAAAGGNILVRADALAKMGGIAAIRNALIDDCALAREIKRNGDIWLGLTRDAESIRRYETFGAIGSMISRNAFYQLRHSVWLLVGTLLGLALTYLAPPILLLFGGRVALLGATAWILMSVAFWPIVKFYSLSPLWVPLLPLVAIFYMGATVHSAIQYWLGRGGEWKGRIQDTQVMKEI